MAPVETHPAHHQSAWTVRMEWGPVGAAAIAEGGGVAVVVDVLSFTTTLTVAVGRGMTVYPFPWGDQRAESYAKKRRAVLAVGRSAPTGISLSPVSVARATGVERLVLPSPNGSQISFGLADSGAVVIGASLRNRSAVAERLAQRSGPVALVAAGERWPDGSLRPAVEDLWGAGAVLAALADLGVTDLSPEARVAEQAFRSVEKRLLTSLRECASGRELVDAGFGADVDPSAELDADDVIPLLEREAFRARS